MNVVLRLGVWVLHMHLQLVPETKQIRRDSSEFNGWKCCLGRFWVFIRCVHSMYIALPRYDGQEVFSKDVFSLCTLTLASKDMFSLCTLTLASKDVFSLCTLTLASKDVFSLCTLASKDVFSLCTLASKDVFSLCTLTLASKEVFSLCTLTLASKDVFILCTLTSKDVFSLCTLTLASKDVFSLCRWRLASKDVFSLCTLTLANKDVFSLCTLTLASKDVKDVFSLCTLTLASKDVFSLCTLTLASKDVLSLCTLTLASKDVFSLCTLKLASKDVFSLCTLTLASKDVLSLCSLTLASKDVFSLCTLTLASKDVFSLCRWTLASKDVFSLCTLTLANKDVFSLCTLTLASKDVFSLCTLTLASKDVFSLCTLTLASKDVFSLCTLTLASKDVLSLCTLTLASKDVLSLCTLTLASKGVFSLCTLTLASKDVFSLCTLTLASKDVFSLCTLTLAKCQNGHPYTIGDCGNPASVSRCRDCNVPIGGQGYKLEQGNRQARQRYLVIKGKCTSMLAGDTKSPRDVSAAIDPHITPNGVHMFLWQHLQYDLHLLSRSSGKSVDDAALTVHMVLHRILKEKPLDGQHFDGHLKTKKSRANWEDIFTRSYISPVVEDLARKLQVANHKVQNDKRLGNNPLLRLLYEVDPPSEKLTIKSLYNVPTVWRYRSRVTIEHLTHALQENTAGCKKHFPILQEFLDKEYKLRALKYLPDIVHLQQLLIDEYHRNIDIHEATNLKIGKFLNKLPRGHVRDKYTRLIKSFSLAWNLVRNEIANYGGLYVSKELCSQPIDENSSIAMVLPTRKADGVCSTALVDFLIITQNEFIDQYVRICKVDSSDDEILPCDLTPAHLIAYDPEKDLLPIVLSHCSYSLQVGRGTLVEYNLSGLERQLEERFIHGKAKIKRKIEQLVFRQDSRDAAVFESLRNRIQQESLSKAIQHQIVTEMKSLTDVCDSLACLDIAIGFLASSGGKADMYIIKYLVDTLKMDKENMKVRHSCQLKHILSLWQLLAVEKARRLTLNSQDPFDIRDFRDQLTEGQIENLQQALQHIQVDALVNELHDYIVIGLEKQKNLMQDEQQDVDNWKLSEILPVYIENKEGEPITGFVEHFPEDILIKHIMSTWEEVIKYQYKDASRR
uniref:E3 ubiquitin-protein ligase RNF213-like n=1 Tax=Saccoglossus kowalevskii TaxID=10224 RepID=A0ABM0MIU5_SACKO|nr:PREDICTED: E3 ubiquitin-protein ligase RNF213-like [Saccoglossus kowalevskii]